MSEPIPEAILWLIFFLPLASFVAIAAFGRRIPPAAAWLTIGAIGLAFALSLWTLIEAISHDGRPMGFGTHELFQAGALTINVGIRLDGLTAVMLVIVTGVSLLVQIYSRGYMQGDGGFARYFAYMSLFTAAMLGLILADNLVMLYAFWELVGLASYLLIGFWFHKPAATAAAKKAFLVTRTGDLGLLAALILIWDRTGTLDIATINTEVVEAVALGLFGQTTLTLFALGLVAGAMGKSAQFPLHIWLPDAMEGPTPVSALIHAATMVAAGVYLLGRFFPVLHTSLTASDFIAWIGAATALGAALIALVQVDIKRVLAYSTISQLGYMMFALGVGGYAAAIFHLMVHAFFKALLFLGAGSVSHATNTFDMRRMGGLRTAMPITYLTFVIGALSLAGIIPLAGFWSKDEILIHAWDHNVAIFFFGLVTAGLTAAYIFRAIFLTFHGAYRGGEQPEAGAHGADPAHPHESPRSMTAPLMILAVLAVVAGFVTFGGEFQGWVLGALPEPEPGEFEFDVGIFIASTVVALAGIGAAFVLYQRRAISVEALRAHPVMARAQLVLENKLYLDMLLEDWLVRRAFYGGLVRAAATFDRDVVDGAVNGVWRGTFQAGHWGRLAQNGQVQAMAVALAAGGLIIWGAVVLF